MELKMTENEQDIEIHLIGDLDLDSTDMMKDQVESRALNFKNVYVNFEQLDFVDSTGLGLLIDMVNTCAEKGIKVHFTKVNEHIREIFDLLQIELILGEEIIVD